MYYMTYRSTITSKGTITIPSSIRKELGLKTGHRVEFSIDAGRKIVVEPEMTMDEFEKLRESIIAQIPKDKLQLRGRKLKKAIDDAHVQYLKKYAK